jgi:hypothetical protein
MEPNNRGTRDSRAVTAFLYIRRGCGIQGTPTGRVRCISRRWRRRQQPARLAAARECAMTSQPMSVRERHQRGQPPEKVERLEDKGCGSAGMRPRPAQMIDDLAVGAARETLLREGSPQPIAQQPLKGFPVVRLYTLCRVEREAGYRSAERLALRTILFPSSRLERRSARRKPRCSALLMGRGQGQAVNPGIDPEDLEAGRPPRRTLRPRRCSARLPNRRVDQIRSSARQEIGRGTCAETVRTLRTRFNSESDQHDGERRVGPGAQGYPFESGRKGFQNIYPAGLSAALRGVFTETVPPCRQQTGFPP